jgi:hypothetical protein
MINLYVSYNQFVFEVGTSKLERFSIICLFNDLSDFSATLKALRKKAKDSQRKRLIWSKDND